MWGYCIELLYLERHWEMMKRHWCWSTLIAVSSPKTSPPWFRFLQLVVGNKDNPPYALAASDWYLDRTLLVPQLVCFPLTKEEIPRLQQPPRRQWRVSQWPQQMKIVSQSLSQSLSQSARFASNHSVLHASRLVIETKAMWFVTVASKLKTHTNEKLHSHQTSDYLKCVCVGEENNRCEGQYKIEWLADDMKTMAENFNAWNEKW